MKKNNTLCVSISNKESGLRAIYKVESKVLKKVISVDASIQVKGNRVSIRTKTTKDFYQINSLLERKALKHISKNFKQTFSYGFGNIGWF